MSGLSLRNLICEGNIIRNTCTFWPRLGIHSRSDKIFFCRACAQCVSKRFSTLAECFGDDAGQSVVIVNLIGVDGQGCQSYDR